MRASLDVLGEYVAHAEQTERYVREVLAALDAIEDRGLEANVSIKPTQFGLALDPALCHANVTRLLERARTHGNWIRLDPHPLEHGEAAGSGFPRGADGHGFDCSERGKKPNKIL